VEFQNRLVRPVGHGIVARRIGGKCELELGELASGEGERAAGFDRQAQPQNVVGSKTQIHDPALHDPRRMHHELLCRKPPDLHVAPCLRAAGKDDPAFALACGQSVFRVLQLEHLARHVFALAGTAIAGLAAVCKAHAMPQQGVEQRLAVLGRNRLRIAGDCDRPGHAGRTKCKLP
jgi:hypothetical protein